MIEWGSTLAGKPPMHMFTGLEVCRPCAWKIKNPVEIFPKETLENLRRSIADSGIGSPRPDAAVRYCNLTHPDYLRFQKMRGQR